MTDKEIITQLEIIAEMIKEVNQKEECQVNRQGLARVLRRLACKVEKETAG